MSLPPFWVLVLIPIFIFFLTGVVPFIVGVYRYRGQTLYWLHWRKKWLEETQQIIMLPEGEVRNEEINGKFEELKLEIKKNFANNKLFQFYQDIIFIDTEEEHRPLEALPYQSQVEDQDMDSKEICKSTNVTDMSQV